MLRLKELRNGKGLLQEDVARLMEIGIRQYQRYERSEHEPDLSGWIFLADLYNVSLDYLVGRSDDPARH